MSWASAIGSIFYCVILCFGAVFNFLWGLLNAILRFLPVMLAPVTHLITYVAHGFLIPIYFLGGFETLYIYLGVAALIGLFAGSFLHFSSSMLVRVLDLQTSPGESGHRAASARTAIVKKGLEDSWQASALIRSSRARTEIDDSHKEYTEYIEKGRGKWKEGQGLLSQTILEEEDDPEDGY